MILAKMKNDVPIHMGWSVCALDSRKNSVANNLVLIVMMITAKNHILMSVPV
jgi:hypothetical protein